MLSALKLGGKGILVGLVLGGALALSATPASAVTLDCNKVLLGGAGPSRWTPGDDAGFSEAALFDPRLEALRTDAFDDGYDRPELGGVEYANPSGADCFKAGAHTLRYPAVTMGAIRLTPYSYVDPKRSFGRVLTTLTNTGGAPATVDFGLKGDNLGSDTDTLVGRTASGDANATVGDSWATTCEDLKDNGCRNVTGERVRDPEIAHNWERQGAKREKADVVTFTNGSDDTEVVFQGVTIPAGKTVAFMEILTLSPTIKEANSAANLTGRKPGKAGAFRELSTTRRNQLLNW
jgi:hypothetical protein